MLRVIDRYLMQLLCWYMFVELQKNMILKFSISNVSTKVVKVLLRYMVELVALENP